MASPSLALSPELPIEGGHELEESNSPQLLQQDTEHHQRNRRVERDFLVRIQLLAFAVGWRVVVQFALGALAAITTWNLRMMWLPFVPVLTALFMRWSTIPLIQTGMSINMIGTIITLLCAGMSASELAIRSISDQGVIPIIQSVAVLTLLLSFVLVGASLHFSLNMLMSSLTIRRIEQARLTPVRMPDGSTQMATVTFRTDIAPWIVLYDKEDAIDIHEPHAREVLEKRGMGSVLPCKVVYPNGIRIDHEAMVAFREYSASPTQESAAANACIDVEENQGDQALGERRKGKRHRRR